MSESPGVAGAYRPIVGEPNDSRPSLARLLKRLAIQISDDSVRLQVIRNSPCKTEQGPVRHLGVDDCAWRKQQTYGTIFVDLDRHKVLDLPPDRAAESVAAWLGQRPAVEIVARDRSGVYAEGQIVFT